MLKDLDLYQSWTQPCESENSIPGSKGLLGFVSLPQTKLKHFVWGKHEPSTPVILLHVMKKLNIVINGCWVVACPKG